MPNWLHLVVNFLYHLGLAMWIGGTVALGALVAPRLFRDLPRQQAGSMFGPILRSFARVRVVALTLTIAAAAVKHFLWEDVATLWISIRWGALLVMAASVVYEIAHLEPELERHRAEMTPGTDASDPTRQAFNRLHRRAERLMKLGLLAALVAFLLS